MSIDVIKQQFADDISACIAKKGRRGGGLTYSHGFKQAIKKLYTNGYTKRQLITELGLPKQALQFLKGYLSTKKFNKISITSPDIITPIPPTLSTQHHIDECPCMTIHSHTGLTISIRF
jgi:hypothetical protein